MADKTISIYVKCCDLFYACSPSKPPTFEALTIALPELREKLTCWSCEELLDISRPYANPDSRCNHFMCGNCRDTVRPFVGQCSQCDKWRLLKINPLLTCIMKGYITLCRSISDTPIRAFYQNQAKITEEENKDKKKSTSSKKKSRMTFLQVLQEAEDFPMTSAEIVLGKAPQIKQEINQ